eukprot:SM000103S09471  [mRNA]  locus=s103:114473:117468:+ [translate_table: standard]
MQIQLPTILARRKAIVVCLGHVKAIITANKVLVFDHHQPRVKQYLLPALAARANLPASPPRLAAAAARDAASAAHDRQGGQQPVDKQRERRSCGLDGERQWQQPLRGACCEARENGENGGGEDRRGDLGGWEKAWEDVSGAEEGPRRTEVGRREEERWEMPAWDDRGGRCRDGEPPETAIGVGGGDGGGGGRGRPREGGAGDGEEGLVFELRMLEAMLEEVDRALRGNFTRLFPDILLRAVLKEGDGSDDQGLSNEDQRRFLILRNRLLRFGLTANQISNALKELLANDEDMAEMYLTRKAASGRPAHPAHHSEVEELVENFVQKAEEVTGEVETLRLVMDATSDHLRSILDSSRNRLLRLDVVLNMATCSAATAGTVAAMFGMNLLSSLEGHPHAFAFVSAGVAASAALLFMAMHAYARRRHIL